MNNILLIILSISVVILFYLKLFTDRTYVVTLQQDNKTKSMVVKASYDYIENIDTFKTLDDAIEASQDLIDQIQMLYE